MRTSSQTLLLVLANSIRLSPGLAARLPIIRGMATPDARDLINANEVELRAFLRAGHRESETLDYKRDLSGDISRTVAAMANSEGGTVIVGVEEDSRTKTPLRYSGFASANPLDQLNGNLSTYLDPTPRIESKVIEFGDAVFLVVLVYPSETRVVLHREKGLLVRVGDESRAPHRSAFEAVIRRQTDAERERVSRVTVLKLLREELGAIPEQMMRRQGRPQAPAPYDTLSDSQWRTLSSSGELRAIADVALRVTITKAYELIGQENELEKKWRDVLGDWGMAGRDVAANNFSNQLKLLDTDTWRRVCDACKAIDTFLLSEGEEPGSNAGRLICF